MRGHILALALLLVACGDEALPPDPSPGDSPGALHNQLIEEFFRAYDGDDEVQSMVEAARVVLPGVPVDAEDVRRYAREAKDIIEGGFVDDPDALATELVRRGILPRQDVGAFKAWVEDPRSPQTFAHRDLAEDVRTHSAALWAGKHPTEDDEIVEDMVDMVGALIGFHLGGSIGSILGGALGSLAFVMLQDNDEDDFWETWTGPIPPKP